MADFNNTPPSAGSIASNVIGNVGNIFSLKPLAKYASGARCMLRINNEIVGFAFAISWRITTSVTEINTIDDYAPYEFAPQRVSVDGSMSLLHIPGTSAGTELWQPDMLSFLFNRYITIEVRDAQSDELLFATDKAMVVSRSEDHRVDDLASVTLQWRAIGFMDERTPEKPKSGDSGLLGSIKGGLKKISGAL